MKWAEPVTYGSSKYEVMTDELHARPVAVVNTLDDAHLISSAPELLAALEFILRGMDGGHIKCAPYFDFDPEAEKVEFKHPADMIRAVIAKAIWSKS